MHKPTPPFLTFLAICLGLAALAAYADDTVSWVLPTKYTDGSSLDKADIDSVVIRWGDGPNPDMVDSVKAPGAVTSFIVARDPAVPGNRCYQVATLMKDGAQSAFAPGAWVCKEIAPPAKKKPKVATQVTVK